MSDAIALLENAGPCVVKRTRDNNSGRGMAVVDFKDGVDVDTGKTVEGVIASMGGDLVCQERVRQHESIYAVYPGCVNTLRIVTYMTDKASGRCP